MSKRRRRRQNFVSSKNDERKCILRMLTKKKNAKHAAIHRKHVSTIALATRVNFNAQNLSTTTTNKIVMFVESKQNKNRAFLKFCVVLKRVSELVLRHTQKLKKIRQIFKWTISRCRKHLPVLIKKGEFICHCDFLNRNFRLKKGKLSVVKT